jgi:hypothetical protein
MRTNPLRGDDPHPLGTFTMLAGSAPTRRGDPGRGALKRSRAPDGLTETHSRLLLSGTADGDT